jgi:hypothetical protein
MQIINDLTLILYNKLTIISNRNPHEIIQLSNKQISIPASPFEGDVDDNGFDIRRKTTYRNSFLPIIKGTVSEHYQGSEMQITMRPHFFVIAFLLLWTYVNLNNLFFLSFAWIISIIGYNIEVFKAKKLLTEMFSDMDNNTIPLSSDTKNISLKKSNKLNEKKIYLYLFYFGLINFFTFFVFSHFLNGDAGSGFIRDGHYFVGNHGQYTEVSKTLWTINKIQCSSLIITHPLAIISAWLYNRSKKS